MRFLLLTLVLLPAPPDLDRAATANAVAQRLDTIQVTETLPPPTTTAAPLTDCEEMSMYRQAAGLPARFDAIGYRESRCTNTPISRTGCCVGFLQLHYIIFADHRMIDRLAACGATWHNVRGDDHGSKVRHMCAAAALFAVAGYQPWSATA